MPLAKVMRHRIPFIIAIFLLGVVSGPLAIYGAWWARFLLVSPFFGLAPGVTVEGVRAIEVGMDESAVRELLGAPLATGPSACSYSADTYVRNCEPDAFTYVYSKPSGNPWYPMLWIHFDSGRVSGVYAKRYDLFDDVGVYGRNATYCAPRDPNRAKGCVWEQPEFTSTFPSAHDRKA